MLHWRDLDLVFGTLVLKHTKMVSIDSQHTLFVGIIGVVSEGNYACLRNIEIYLEKDCLLVRKFLVGRTKRVRVGGQVSKEVEVTSGVPQGAFWAHHCSWCK